MGRLLALLTDVPRLLTGLILCLFALPFFGIWRLFLLFLSSLEKPLRALPMPTIAIYTPAHAHFIHHWEHFHNLPVLSLAKLHRNRILATLLVIISSGLAFALFVKTSILFVPWLLDNMHKRSPYARNAMLLHAAMYIATCAPLAFVFGVGAALFYYARKYWKYGKFEKNMRRKPGGRGYWAEPMDKKRRGKRVHVDGKVLVEKKTLDSIQRAGDVGKDRTGRDEVKLYGGIGEEEMVLRRPERAMMLPGRPAASFESKKFTRDGVGSMWSNKTADKFKGGYDGRKVRRRAWEEDVEMSDRVGKK